MPQWLMKFLEAELGGSVEGALWKGCCGTEHLQCGCLQFCGLTSQVVERNRHFWAAIHLLKEASSSAEEWGSL